MKQATPSLRIGRGAVQAKADGFANIRRRGVVACFATPLAHCQLVRSGRVTSRTIPSGGAALLVIHGVSNYAVETDRQPMTVITNFTLSILTQALLRELGAHHDRLTLDILHTGKKPRLMEETQAPFEEYIAEAWRRS